MIKKPEEKNTRQDTGTVCKYTRFSSSTGGLQALEERPFLKIAMVDPLQNKRASHEIPLRMYMWKLLPH
jgi:hypothetical protein